MENNGLSKQKGPRLACLSLSLSFFYRCISYWLGARIVIVWLLLASSRLRIVLTPWTPKNKKKKKKKKGNFLSLRIAELSPLFSSHWLVVYAFWLHLANHRPSPFQCINLFGIIFLFSFNVSLIEGARDARDSCKRFMRAILEWKDEWIGRNSLTTGLSVWVSASFLLSTHTRKILLKCLFFLCLAKPFLQYSIFSIFFLSF